MRIHTYNNTHTHLTKTAKNVLRRPKLNTPEQGCLSRARYYVPKILKQTPGDKLFSTSLRPKQNKLRYGPGDGGHGDDDDDTATQRQNNSIPVEVGAMKTVWRQVYDLSGSAFGGQSSESDDGRPLWSTLIPSFGTVLAEHAVLLNE